VGLGLRETMTYSLVSAADHQRLGVPDDQVVRLANPMTGDHAELRATSVGSLLDVIHRNRANGIEDIAVFEQARNFHRGDDGGPLPTFAHEQRVFALAAAGSLWGRNVDFATISGIATTLLNVVGLAFELRPSEAPPTYLHPGQCADVVVADGTVAGVVGVVHPGVAADADIKGDVVTGELYVHEITQALPRVHRFRAYSTFPPVRQDIAVIVPGDVLAGDVTATVRTSGGDLLSGVAVFDRYEGESIGEGRYSLALRLEFRAADRTLTDDEVATVRTQITDALAAEHGAQLRDG
jgi:phenylalanyl-tRNA synthetase beta chain